MVRSPVPEVQLKLRSSDLVLRKLAYLYIGCIFVTFLLVALTFLPAKMGLCCAMFLFPLCVCGWTMRLGVSTGGAVLFLLATLPWSLRANLAFLSYAPQPPAAEAPRFGCPLPLPSKIDALLSWVNVTDIAWQERARSHGCPVDKYVSGAGDADPFDSLRFAIRSIRKNLKFVDKIYITTEDQEIDWLSKDDPSIQVLPHSAFMDKSILPVFNSQPTEYSIHKIQFDYSCFLYLNDDFLVMQELQITDFIDPTTGRPVFYGYEHVRLSNLLPSSVPAFLDLPFGFFAFSGRAGGEPGGTAVVDPHVPYLVSAAAMEAYAKDGRKKKSLEKVFEDRCKRQGVLWPEEYFRYMLEFDSLKFVSPLDGLVNRFGLGLTFLDLGWNIAIIEKLKPKFVYIESHDSVEHRPGAVDLVKAFLTRHFPDKGLWELY